jgi:hypothetical protein
MKTSQQAIHVHAEHLGYDYSFEPLEAMATDALTGIRIGKTFYRENVVYKGGGALSDLLSKVDFGNLTLGDFEAEIDIKPKRLSIFISSTVASFPSKLKVVFAGDAIISPKKTKLANDFNINRVGAGIYADTFFGPTEAVGNTRTKPALSLNKAFRGLIEGLAPLRNARLGSAQVYSMGAITPLIAPRLEELNIATTDRTTAIDPFAPAFSNQASKEWWNTGI